MYSKGLAGVPGPRFSWSMTDADLGTRYVTSLIFYEKLSDQESSKCKTVVKFCLIAFSKYLPMEQGNIRSFFGRRVQVNARQHLFVPKILNVVSKHCFYRGFQEFLTQLFRVSLSESNIPTKIM